MTTEIFWLWCAVALLASATINALVLAGRGGDRSWREPTLVTMSVVSVAMAIAVRWVRTGQGPFLTLFEALLSNLFSLGLVLAVAYALVPVVRQATVVTLPVLLLMGLWALSTPMDSVPLPATFEHAWLWLHILFGKLFLGPCLVGAGLSALLLWRARHGEIRIDGASGGNALANAWVWRLMAIAFVFQSLMLLAGAVWAHDAWGRYWAWDPLETWALITWLALALVLHARATFRLPGVVAWSGVILVFLLAFVTFFGVPFISVAPHKGVM